MDAIRKKMATMKVKQSPNDKMTNRPFQVRHGHNDGGNMDNRECLEKVGELHKRENWRDQGHREAGDIVLVLGQETDSFCLFVIDIGKQVTMFEPEL